MAPTGCLNGHIPSKNWLWSVPAAEAGQPQKNHRHRCHEWRYQCGSRRLCPLDWHRWDTPVLPVPDTSGAILHRVKRQRYHTLCSPAAQLLSPPGAGETHADTESSGKRSKQFISSKPAPLPGSHIYQAYMHGIPSFPAKDVMSCRKIHSWKSGWQRCDAVACRPDSVREELGYPMPCQKGSSSARSRANS